MRLGRERSSSPFRLYQAAVEGSAEYAGSGICAFCRTVTDGRLALSVGADVIYRCTTCEQPFPVRAEGHDRRAKTCPHCGMVDDGYPLGDDPATCYPCLSSGRAALTKDTEFGMVTWSDAVRGRTHGVPGLARTQPGFSLADPDPDGWVAVNIPPSVLLDLVHTPSYRTYQGVEWLFCCATTMLYCGEWTKTDFTNHKPGDPEVVLIEVFEGAQPWMWNQVPNDPQHDTGWGFYVFECELCNRTRGHFDMT
ncbi:CbrC family protein [Dactylosporangium sp. NPDC005555]|uniref:CbrC family protein n=1 Tax=Dactylosporangium sp. NPDC005555 TaxID=3154889 RepID=UPI0033BBEF15